jgi:hypothetical protein
VSAAFNAVRNSVPGSFKQPRLDFIDGLKVREKLEPAVDFDKHYCFSCVWLGGGGVYLLSSSNSASSSLLFADWRLRKGLNPLQHSQYQARFPLSSYVTNWMDFASQDLQNRRMSVL